MAELSIFGKPVSKPSAGKTNRADANRLAHGRAEEPARTRMPRNKRKPATNSTVTGSNQETADEIAGCQTLDRDRWSQDQRQSRKMRSGHVLKEIAGTARLTLSDLVASIDTDRRDGNLSSAIRLFVLDHYRAQIGDQRGSQPVVHDGSSARASSSVLRAD